MSHFQTLDQNETMFKRRLIIEYNWIIFIELKFEKNSYCLGVMQGQTLWGFHVQKWSLVSSWLAQALLKSSNTNRTRSAFAELEEFLYPSYNPPSRRKFPKRNAPSSSVFFQSLVVWAMSKSTFDECWVKQEKGDLSQVRVNGVLFFTRRRYFRNSHGDIVAVSFLNNGFFKNRRF